MLTEVREDISEKKAALDDLPLETGRLDIISYATSPPSQYSLLFPSQRLKSSWEADFLKHKSTADQQAPPNDMVAPPTSPPPVPAVSHDMKFLHPMVLQSGRVGTKVSQSAFIGWCVCLHVSTFIVLESQVYISSFLVHTCV